MNDQNFPAHSATTVGREYQTLLKITESIALHSDLSELFHDLSQPLRHILQFDYLSLRLHDARRNVMRRHILERSLPGQPFILDELPVNESLSGLVWQNQQPILIESVAREVRFARAMQVLTENGVKSCCSLPLSTAHRQLGAITLGSAQERAYQPTDLEFFEQVAKHVSVAVDNTLTHQQLARERDRLRLLLEVTDALVSSLDIDELFATITSSVRRLLPNEYTTLTLYEPETDMLRLEARDLPSNNGRMRPQLLVRPEEVPTGAAFRTGKPVVYDRKGYLSFPSEVVEYLASAGINSLCCLPLISRNGVIGTLNVATRNENAFGAGDVELLSQVANQTAIAIENALAYRQIRELKDKLTKEKLYLEDEIRTKYNFEQIIGESPALGHVLKQVETVAPTDSTVLIHGETGTGKELIARAIHNLSSRRERTFVKINCAAIPTGLLESELFGHEKGAFTGAIAQRIGRFELADGGTLFLDEVGDIPLELQPKLLRVLQEKEFERLGSSNTRRVNVRLIAASNADLVQLVEDKQFRIDLYYRLNVFPILIPPLRERREDISLLVRHFVQKYARRMKKQIDTIAAGAMKALSEYSWPGNVRELEHFIERAVILSRGAALEIPLAELRQTKKLAPAAVPDSHSTLEQAEREHILRALNETKWMIGGPAGAAARLGTKRTTLQYRMKKLGITRRK
jgi:formate hydrogenlyase transcriptional activator